MNLNSYVIIIKRVITNIQNINHACSYVISSINLFIMLCNLFSIASLNSKYFISKKYPKNYHFVYCGCKILHCGCKIWYCGCKIWHCGCKIWHCDCKIWLSSRFSIFKILYILLY